MLTPQQTVHPITLQHLNMHLVMKLLKKVTSNILAQRGVSRGYTDPSTELCFFSDGTVSANTTGYEISYRDRSYRLSVWITGFYEVLRYSEVSCPAEKRAYDRDNNIIQNW